VKLDRAMGAKTLENCLLTGLAIIFFREFCDMEKKSVNILNITA
jgi:hypothetical protein